MYTAALTVLEDEQSPDTSQHLNASDPNDDSLEVEEVGGDPLMTEEPVENDSEDEEDTVSQRKRRGKNVAYSLLADFSSNTELDQFWK